MKIYNRKTHVPSTGRRADTPKLTISRTGLFTLNKPLEKLLKVGADDKIVIAEQDGDYYVAKDDSTGDGFILRRTDPRKNLLFNCTALMVELRDGLDLAINPEQKRSVRMDINTEALYVSEVAFYKIY